MLQMMVVISVSSCSLLWGLALWDVMSGLHSATGACHLQPLGCDLHAWSCLSGWAWYCELWGQVVVCLARSAPSCAKSPLFSDKVLQFCPLGGVDTTFSGSVDILVFLSFVVVLIVAKKKILTYLEFFFSTTVHTCRCTIYTCTYVYYSIHHSNAHKCLWIGFLN